MSDLDPSGIAKNHNEINDVHTLETSVDVVESGEGGTAKSAAVLEQLGYKEELVRVRGFPHIFSMTVTCLAVPYGYGSALFTAIIGGGPATLIWGSLIVSVLYWTMAYSLGEIASKFPTSAGPYYYTYQLAPKSVRRALSYITGWTVLIATLMASLSVSFGLSQHIIGTVNIIRPDVAPAQWVYILMAYALLAIASLPVFLSPKLLTYLDQINFVWTWAYKLIYIVVLLVRAKAGRRSASYAFTHYDASFSGWGNGWTFFIGLLPAAYANCSIGMVVAMAEEVRSPEINIPKAMVWAMPCSWILAWAFILPMTLTMPDMEVLLEAPGGIVMPHAFKLIISNDVGAVLMMVGIMGIGFFCLIAIITSASRLMWSFSRDRAVPGWQIWSRVSNRGNIPAAIALCVAIQALVCLVDLGSTLAFNSFVGAAIIAFIFSYLIPIVCSLWEGRNAVDSAPFGTPLLGRICNYIVIAWAALASVLFSMPIALPLTAASMNYASVVLFGLMGLAGAWYWIRGRKAYRGPPTIVPLTHGM